MNEHLKTGYRGEQAACAYLEALGFRILERNWRYKRAEIDIIAMEGDVLVFLEVKTRSSERYGSPEVFVSKRKQQLLTSAASAFCLQLEYTGEIRFDVVAVIASRKDCHVTLLRDAFFPGL